MSNSRLSPIRLYTTTIPLSYSSLDLLFQVSQSTTHTLRSLQLTFQVPSSSRTRENPHDPKSHIKHPQRIRYQPAHTPHSPHRTKHLTTTIRTPPNRHSRQHIPDYRIQWHDHSHKPHQHQRQQTIPQHARRARKRQARRHMLPTVSMARI